MKRSDEKREASRRAVERRMLEEELKSIKEKTIEAWLPSDATRMYELERQLKEGPE